jgi:hypothetical protein
MIFVKIDLLAKFKTGLSCVFWDELASLSRFPTFHSPNKGNSIRQCWILPFLEQVLTRHLKSAIHHLSNLFS